MKNIFKFLFVFIVALFSLGYIDLNDTNKENLKYDINKNLKDTKENNPIINLENNFEEDKIDDKKAYRYIIDDIEEKVKLPNIIKGNYGTRKAVRSVNINGSESYVYKLWVKEDGNLVLRINEKVPKEGLQRAFASFVDGAANMLVPIVEFTQLDHGIRKVFNLEEPTEEELKKIRIEAKNNILKTSKLHKIELTPTDPEYKYIIENNPEIASMVKYVKGEGIDLDNPKNILQYNTGYNEKDYVEYEDKNLKNTQKNNLIIDFENNFEKDEEGFFIGKDGYKYIGDDIKKIKLPNKIVGNYDTEKNVKSVNINGSEAKVSNLWIKEDGNLVLRIIERIPKEGLQKYIGIFSNSIYDNLLPITESLQINKLKRFLDDSSDLTYDEWKEKIEHDNLTNPKLHEIELKPTDPEYKYIIENNEKIASMVKYVKGEGMDLTNPENIVQYNTGYNEKDYKEYENKDIKNTKKNNPKEFFEENFEKDEKGFFIGEDGYKYIGDDIKKIKLPNKIVGNYATYAKSLGDTKYVNINGKNSKVFDLWIQENEDLILYIREHLPLPAAAAKTFIITLKPTDPEYKYIIENNPEIASMIKYVKGENDLY